MKNLREKRNKNVMFTIIASLIFLLSVSCAIATTSSELWTEWGYNSAGTQNRLGDSTVFGTVTNLTEHSQTSYGGFYQPLVNDLDFDGAFDIVVQSGSYLLVYNSTWGLQAQELMTLYGQPTMTTVSDLDNDGFTNYESYIVAHNKSSIFIYDFNGSTISTLIQMNVSENVSLKTNGFKCVMNDNDDSEMCFIKYSEYANSSVWENESHRVAGGHLHFTIPTTCHNTSCISSLVYWEFAGLNNTLTTIPNFYNLDDGTVAREMIMWSDKGNNGSYGYSVYYITSNTRMLYVDDIFSDSTEYVDSYGRNNPIMYDLDTGGDAEIYFYKIQDKDAGGANLYAYCYDTAGNTCTGFPAHITAQAADLSGDACGVYGSAFAWLTNLAIMEVEGDKVLGFLGFGYGSVNTFECGWRYCGASPSDYNFLGYIYPNGTIFYDENCPTPTWAVGSGGRDELYLTSADFNNDNNDDWVNPLAIFMNNNISDNHTLNDGDYWTIPIDLDGDVFFDILSLGSAAGYTYLSGGANTGGSIDEISSDTGEPTCIGEQVDFTVTGYTDIELEAIRLRIDCLGNGTYTSWSDSSYAPSNTCNFSRYGTFDTTFSITDASHYPTQTDTLICDWTVDSGNCYGSGEGGGLACQATSNGTGYNTYHVNMTAVDELIGGGSGRDGYTSSVFDWEGSGCDDWTYFRGACPAWVWATQGLEDIWDWIFGTIAVFLALILIIVIIWFVSQKEKLVPVRM